MRGGSKFNWPRPKNKNRWYVAVIQPSIKIEKNNESKSMSNLGGPTLSGLLSRVRNLTHSLEMGFGSYATLNGPRASPKGPRIGPVPKVLGLHQEGVGIKIIL